MGRWIPKLFFFLVIGLGVFLAVIEVRTHLAFPLVDRLPHPSGWGTLILYHKGGRHRAADVFFEDLEGGLWPVAPLYYEGRDRRGRERTRFDELRWTGDGAGLFASSGANLLWFFDLQTGATRWAGDSGHDPLRDSVREHGGLGDRAAQWFAIGGKNGRRRLWSWQTTRYAHPRNPSVPPLSERRE